MIFAQNKLEILVQPGNPKQIKTTGRSRSAGHQVRARGGRPCPPASTPPRSLAKRRRDGEPRVEGADVKSAVAKVTSGEADATIVYVRPT